MRDVGFAAVLLAAVLTACIPGPLSGPAGTGGGLAPERHEGAAARLAADLEDQATEQDRIEAAERYRTGAGGGVGVHTVSMAEPVPPGDFVDAVAAAGLMVKTVHVWQQSPGSDEIGTGIVESDTGAPAADDPAFVGHLETVFGDSPVGDRQLAVFGFV